MKQMKGMLLLILVIMNVFMMTGCWSYREIDKLGIVSGVAIDKGSQNNKYRVTVELIAPQGGKSPTISSKVIGAEGETIFDAIRNIIRFPGKKLFWSHAKIIIISQDIAKEGLLPTIDWLERGAEARLEARILISKEKTAEALWQKNNILSEIRAYELNDVLSYGTNLSKIPEAEVYKFIQDLSASGISAVLPTVELVSKNGTNVSQIAGSAIFRKDKLAGFLNEDETRSLLFVRNLIKGGIIPQNESSEHQESDVSLEILKSNTKLKPAYIDDKLTMNINIRSEVEIVENGTSQNFMDEKQRQKLQKHVELKLKRNITGLIKKVQESYGIDIFGFGKKIKVEMPEAWKGLESNWEKEFKDLDVNVNVTLNIRGSVLTTKPIQIGD